MAYTHVYKRENGVKSALKAENENSFRFACSLILNR